MTSESFEEWRYIRNTGMDYMVSSMGNVKSMARFVMGGKHKKILKKERLLKSHNHRGYRRLSISVGGNSKMHLVHRLVALSFINNPNNLPEVNHKDGNKSNNVVNNLEWVSRSANMSHAKKNGLMYSRVTRGEDSTNVKYTESDILTIRDMYIHGVRQCDIARLFEIKRGTVWSIVNMKTWKHI